MRAIYLSTLHRLPGRALADSRTIWLCNAQYAESNVFSRSLLAKVGFLLVGKVVIHLI